MFDELQRAGRIPFLQLVLKVPQFAHPVDGFLVDVDATALNSDLFAFEDDFLPDLIFVRSHHFATITTSPPMANALSKRSEHRLGMLA